MAAQRSRCKRILSSLEQIGAATTKKGVVLHSEHQVCVMGWVLIVDLTTIENGVSRLQLAGGGLLKRGKWRQVGGAE
jgi:hypothetical protein